MARPGAMAAWDAGFPQSRKRGNAMAAGRFPMDDAFPPKSIRLPLHRFAALVLVTTTLGMSVSSADGEQPAGSRSAPNIIMILADDKYEQILSGGRRTGRRAEKTENECDLAGKKHIVGNCRRFMQIGRD
jgi:hypothetical protein